MPRSTLTFQQVMGPETRRLYRSNLLSKEPRLRFVDRILDGASPSTISIPRPRWTIPTVMSRGRQYRGRDHILLEPSHLRGVVKSESFASDDGGIRSPRGPVAGDRLHFRERGGPGGPPIDKVITKLSRRGLAYCFYDYYSRVSRLAEPGYKGPPIRRLAPRLRAREIFKNNRRLFGVEDYMGSHRHQLDDVSACVRALSTRYYM